MTRSVLGLDLGPNSIGWAILEESEETGEVLGFLDTSHANHPPAGSRVFEAGLANFDSAKEESLCQKRRFARSTRKNHARRNARRKQLKEYLSSAGMFPVDFDCKGKDPNGLLNYGYSVLRAAMARAICAAGLQPGMGIHHTNRYSGFCLADDLMEPFRPFVDQAVFHIVKNGGRSVNSETKPAILNVLGRDVDICGEITNLSMALEITASSVAKCFELQVKDGVGAPQAAKALKLPRIPEANQCH